MKQKNCVMFCRKRALRLNTDFRQRCQIQHPASHRAQLPRGGTHFIDLLRRHMTGLFKGKILRVFAFHIATAIWLAASFTSPVQAADTVSATKPDLRTTASQAAQKVSPPAYSGLRPTPSQLQSAKDLHAISFTENKGQAPAGILWTTQGVNFRAEFSKGSFILQTARPMPEALETGKRANTKALPVTASAGTAGSVAAGQNEPPKVQIEDQRIELEGANPLSKIEPLDERPGKVSFFEGKDPSRWVKGASTYARLRYKEIYPGIDLVFYGKDGRLEYDFVVAAGADPNLIRMKIDGNDAVSITDQGELRLGDVVHRPQLYQNLDHGKRMVEGKFVALAGDRVGFAFANYDRTKTFVIDPAINLLYSTYAGGIHNDQALGMTVDLQGNTYLTGWAASQDFPVTGNALQTTRMNIGFYLYDVIVMKFDPSGTLLYSTFLGGSQNDQGGPIVANPDGSVYVGGYTQSADFPTTSNAFQKVWGGGLDGFLARISSDGSQLLYSTYLGGPGDEAITSMILNADGSLWMSGVASQAGLPASANAFQPQPNGIDNSFVAKAQFDQNGNLQLPYLTFIGGSQSGESNGPGEGWGSSLALDATGNVYIAGATESSDYPVTANAYEKPVTLSHGCDNSPNPNTIGVVTKFSPDLSQMLYSTYFGGKTEDQNGFPDCNEGIGTIRLDAKGNIWLYGYTAESDLPITANAISSQLNGNGTAGQDTFLAELSPDGTTLLYGTYLGGSGQDGAGPMAFDAAGNIWLSGNSNSTNYPVTSDALQAQVASGGFDFTLTELSPDGTKILYSTYLGGTADNGANGIAMALDGSGNIHLSGATSSASFPVTPNALQPIFANGDVGPDGDDVFYTVLGTGTIGTIGPVVGGNTGDTTITVSGAGFESGATCSLVSGTTTIASASAVVNAAGTEVSCTFALNGEATGSYNVVVSNTNGTSFTDQNAFTVESGAGPNIWLDVVGRSAVRFNTPTTFTVAYGNSGDTDAIAVPIFISVPSGATVQLSSGLTALPKLSDFDPNTLPSSFQLNGATVIPIIIPRVAAGGSGSIQVQLTVPSSSSTFEIDAYNWAPFASSLASLQAAESQAQRRSLLAPRLLFPRPEDATNPGPSDACLQDMIQLSLSVASAVIPGGGCISASAGLLSSVVQSALSAAGPGSSASVGYNIGGIVASGAQAILNCSATAAGLTPAGMVLNLAIAAAGAGLQGAQAAEDCSQPAQPNNSQKKTGTGVGAIDPNDKSGPVGDGSSSQYIAGGKALSYDVAFENQPTATAPASQVVVADQLDPTKVDLTTLTLGTIMFGTNVINLPSGTNNYNTTYALNSSLNVRIQGSLNQSTGLLKWTFTSIDPSTGLPPTDPTVGFLPPDVDGVEGQASVLFNVMPKSGQSTGTQITNTASVVFDSNAAISTPTWLNTLDVTAPVSSVAALPAAEITTSPTATFTVNWSGTDAGSGIASYNIYVSDNGGALTLWQSAVTTTSASYTGTLGHTYGFYSIATDKAGNIEAAKTSPDTSTTVTTTPLVSTTMLTSSNSSIASGSSVTFTAVVAPPSGTTAAPTGTVTFLNGTTTLGTGPLNGTGTATYTTTALPVGTDSITAQYGGDTAFAASASAAVSVVVGTPNFSLSLSPASVSIAGGGSGGTTITATPAFGFASAITFACSGLPADATCSFSPATVTPGGSATATTKLTIATNVASASLGKDLPTPWSNGRKPMLCIFLFGGLGLLRVRRYFRNLTRSHALLNLAVFALLLLGMAGAAVIGCGGGSSNSTPAGTSTVTITATGGSQTQTTTLSVTVQ
jgi:Bacterial Ig-like domain (group 3)